MQEATISVIVPVYNTKTYLPRCVESVLRQAEISVQLLLVDDGSTDGSGQLCDALAAAHDTIAVLHQPNSGAAAARDAGLAAASGEYVLFLDSDDCYLSDTAFVQMVATARQHDADVVCFDYVRVRGEAQECPLSSTGVCGDIVGEKTAAVSEMLRRNVYTSSACLKLMQRSLLEQWHLRFRTALRCEDIPFCLRLLVRARHPVFLGARLYGYTVREDSKTRVCSAAAVQDTLTALINMRKEISAQDALFVPYMSYIAFQYCTLLINAHLAQPATEAATWKRIYAQKDLLQYRENKIVRMVFFCAKLLGVPLTSRLLALYFKKKG